MLQRILCVLLSVLLLLPAVSLAEGTEAIQFDMTWEANEDGVQTYLENRGFAPDTRDALTRAMTALMNTLSLHMGVQSTGAYAAVSIDEACLLDLSMELGKKAGLIRSNMFPGMAISITDDGKPDIATALLALDWQSMEDKLLHSLDLFLSDTTVRASKENTEGDVYTGGGMCVTMEFDDRRLAAWLNELALLMEPVTTTLKEYELLTDADLQAFFAKNQQVAQENQFMYEFRCVFRSSSMEEFIGIELFAFTEEYTEAILSIGIPYEGDPRHTRGEVELLFSYGADEWVREQHVLVWLEETDGRESIHLEATQYHTDEWQLVETLKAAGEELRDWHFTASAGQAVSKDRASSAYTGQTRLEVAGKGLIESEHEYTVTEEPFQLHAETRVYAGNERKLAWIWRADAADAEARTFASPSETVVDITEMESSELLNEAIEKAGVQMGVTLLQHLPPELLMLLVQWTN